MSFRFAVKLTHWVNFPLCFQQLSSSAAGNELPQLPLPLSDGNAIKVLTAKPSSLQHQETGTICLLNFTLTVLVVTIDAQWEGMGDVGSAR